MINFVNKNGKKVMEMKDNGDIKVLDENLKKDLKLQEGVVNEEEEQEK